MTKSLIEQSDQKTHLSPAIPLKDFDFTISLDVILTHLQKEVLKKLYRQLRYDYYVKHSACISIRMATIAKCLKCRREAVSRAITELKKLGYISQKRNRRKSSNYFMLKFDIRSHQGHIKDTSKKPKFTLYESVKEGDNFTPNNSYKDNPYEDNKEQQHTSPSTSREPEPCQLEGSVVEIKTKKTQINEFRSVTKPICQSADYLDMVDKAKQMELQKLDFVKLIKRHGMEKLRDAIDTVFEDYHKTQKVVKNLPGLISSAIQGEWKSETLIEKEKQMAIDKAIQDKIRLDRERKEKENIEYELEREQKSKGQKIFDSLSEIEQKRLIKDCKQANNVDANPYFEDSMAKVMIYKELIRSEIKINPLPKETTQQKKELIRQSVAKFRGESNRPFSYTKDRDNDFEAFEDIGKEALKSMLVSNK